MFQTLIVGLCVVKMAIIVNGKQWVFTVAMDIQQDFHPRLVPSVSNIKTAWMLIFGITWRLNTLKRPTTYK